EAPGQRSVHLAPERVEVEVEGPCRETLARGRADRRERQKPLDRLVERLRKIRGPDRAVHEPDALALARGDRLAEQGQLLRPPEPDQPRQGGERPRGGGGFLD